MKAGRKTKLEKKEKKTKHLKKYFFWALTASNDSGFVLKQKKWECSLRIQTQTPKVGKF